MKSLEELNQKWKKWFNKNRVGLVTKYSIHLIDFMEMMEITDVYSTDDFGWAFRIYFEEADYVFEVAEDGYIYTATAVPFEGKELYEFRNILYDLDITKYIKRIRKEKKQEAFQKGKNEHIGLKIKNVFERDDTTIIYELESGETLVVQIK